MSIAEKALVVHMTVGVWTGAKVDHDRSTDHQLVHKQVVPKSALAGVIKALGALRTHFYVHTAPWKDNGDRLLPVVTLVEFLREHTRLRKAFQTQAEAFAAKHDCDRDRFYVKLSFDMVCNPACLALAGVDGERLETVRGKLNAELAERTTRAQRFLWEKLEQAVGHYAERLLSGAVFRDSTVDNLQQAIRLAPALNFLDDPELDSLIEIELSQLLSVTPAQIRKEPQVRVMAGAGAQSCLAQIRRKLR
jgi:hypothetical protein